MKITLVMAITINGYIAGLDDDTSWIKDVDVLNETIARAGVVMMGKRTYGEAVKYKDFPYKGAINIVFTHDQNLISQTKGGIIFTDKAPFEVIEFVKQMGLEQILLIGGGHLNGLLMQAGLIDELILDIHPLIKARGIHLFENEFADMNLELISSKEINDQIIQMKYRVKKFH